MSFERPRSSAQVHEEQTEPRPGSNLDEVAAPFESGRTPRRRAVPVRRGDKSTAEVVAPAVVVDLDRLRRPLLGTHRETAVVGADVVKGAQHAVVAAHKDKRLAEELERTHVARRGQRRLEADRHPVPVEDARRLELEETRRGEGSRGQGRRPLDRGANRFKLLRGQLDIGGAVVRTSDTRRAGSRLHEAEHGSQHRSTRWKCSCRGNSHVDVSEGPRGYLLSPVFTPPRSCATRMPHAVACGIRRQ